MSCLRIKGGNRLEGKIKVSGSKNSGLALMVGAALGVEDVLLTNVPYDTDILVMAEILRGLGVKVEEAETGQLIINGANLKCAEVPYELARRLRASFYIAGLLLARLGEARVPLPGGCFLGPRPVDFHIKGFQSLGAEVAIEHGLMGAKMSSSRMSASANHRIFINRCSMGTTINLMYLAAMSPGVTILENCAKEPEIVDLAVLLNSMGAKIRGAGTEIIRIQGVKKLHATEHSIIIDRIEAGTFMAITAATGGDIVVENTIADYLRTPIMKLREAGVEITEDESEIRVRSTGRINPIDIETAPYPGFPTDLQQPFGALMTIAQGTSIVRETIYDNRFRYLDELSRMGAEIRVDRDRAIIKGVPRLSGAPVETTDLRAGAALVLAGLMAEGTTVVSNAEIIDRGYEDLVQKLRSLGADIEREE